MVTYEARLPIAPALAEKIKTYFAPHDKDHHQSPDEELSKSNSFEGSNLFAYVGSIGCEWKEGGDCRSHAQMVLYSAKDEDGTILDEVLAQSEIRDDFFGDWMVTYKGDAYILHVYSIKKFYTCIDNLIIYDEADNTKKEVILALMRKVLGDITRAETLEDAKASAGYLLNLMEAGSSTNWLTEGEKVGLRVGEIYN